MNIRIPRKYIQRSLALIIFSVCWVGVAEPVSAQNFAGSDITNYYCPGKTNESGVFVSDFEVKEVNGDYLCDYDKNGTPETRAVPRPPTLRQLEYWFVKIVYLAWAAAGIIFTGILMWIGWLYMTSFRNEFLMADVIKRARSWVLGLAIVFLAYPILNTFFNVLGLRQSECFEGINLPGFQFFFSNACRIDQLSVDQCKQNCQVLSDPTTRRLCEDDCDMGF